jgi:hypothetical protein
VSLTDAEERFDSSYVGGLFVVGQAFDEEATILLFQNAVVEQHQQTTVMQRANEAAEALLQRDNGSRHLILKEGVASLGVNGFHTCGDDGIAWYRERQAIDDDATELLSLNVHPLPE